MIGRCVSQQLSQVIPSTPVCEKSELVASFDPNFSGQKFRPQFLAAFSTQAQPRWQTGRAKGFVSLNKIGLNFSTSTHICNYLISNMKHTLQNLCLGRAGVGRCVAVPRERLKRYLGLMRYATTAQARPVPSKYIYRLTFTHFYGKWHKIWVKGFLSKLRVGDFSETCGYEKGLEKCKRPRFVEEIKLRN